MPVNVNKLRAHANLGEVAKNCDEVDDDLTPEQRARSAERTARAYEVLSLLKLESESDTWRGPLQPECRWGYPEPQVLRLVGPDKAEELRGYMQMRAVAMCLEHGTVYYAADVSAYAERIIARG